MARILPVVAAAEKGQPCHHAQGISHGWRCSGKLRYRLMIERSYQLFTIQGVVGV